jgi:endonuclease/exonuclease/phosphatase family metal-dependent hydrolase
MLDDLHAPTPDIVLGDFNITRGSASIATAFPGMTEAYDSAGHGYGASYHRRFPLWHIDHMLLGPNVHPLRYDLVNPHISRHDAQVAWIQTTTAR